MLIEVLFNDRIGNYKKDQVVELEEGPFLLAVLKGGKADVLNPPDWSLETSCYGKKTQDPVQPTGIYTTKEIIEQAQLVSVVEKENGKSYSQSSTDREASSD